MAAFAALTACLWVTLSPLASVSTMEVRGVIASNTALWIDPSTLSVALTFWETSGLSRCQALMTWWLALLAEDKHF